eukprot:GHVO01004883.1.p1 GENE.GHVO01004883.1~~GHVO01004883.1.p1  ORF type:complete len:467 (+),score=76.12 GHVO01004883.1:58-1401(+)
MNDNDSGPSKFGIRARELFWTIFTGNDKAKKCTTREIQTSALQPPRQHPYPPHPCQSLSAYKNVDLFAPAPLIPCTSEDDALALLTTADTDDDNGNNDFTNDGAYIGKRASCYHIPPHFGDDEIEDEDASTTESSDEIAVIKDYDGNDISRLSTTESQDEEEVSKRFIKSRVLGEGTYGVVYEAVCRRRDVKVALKKLRIDTSHEAFEQGGLPTSAIREVVLLRDLDHPNIVSLLDVFHKATELWLVFEYCDLDLKQLLVRERRKVTSFDDERGNGKPAVGLSLERCRFLSYQLLLGMHYCHSRRIMHRDLKPQNLLLSKKGTVLKIADFGLARTFRIPMDGPITHEVVTLWYRAPELLLGECKYGTPIDMWSVGCILAEMVVGKSLFPGDCETDMIFRIFRTLGTPKRDEGIKNLPFFQKAFPNWSPNPTSSLQDILGGGHRPSSG